MVTEVHPYLPEIFLGQFIFLIFSGNCSIRLFGVSAWAPLASLAPQTKQNKPTIQTRSTNKPKILKDFIRLAFKERYTAS